MNKTYQIIRGIEVPTSATSKYDTGVMNTKSTTERVKDGYSRVTGLFFVSHAKTNDLAGVSVGLKIAQQEVLPLGFDASLITFSPDVSRSDCLLDLSAENIPARSSELEITVELTNDTVARSFDVYLVLEK